MLRPWQIVLGERIDPSRSTPVYMQIIHSIIHDIETGRLSSGTFLPSSRELAKMLDVNRKTVVFAYEDLIAQGWLCSVGTRGTMVSESLPKQNLSSKSEDSAGGSETAGFSFRAPPERPLAVPQGTGLKLDEGSPDGRIFPFDQLARAYRAAIQKTAQANRFQYLDPKGSENLREQIAEMLRSQRGLPVTMDNICVTRGSQNALFLSLQVLVKPGDAVIVEELTYEPAVAAIKAIGGQVLPVGLDEGGINVEEVELACRRHAVRAIFLTPHHQFPTTVALRPERRLPLLELARKYGFAIIEDDYDHEFHFQSQPLLPMASYALEQVMYVGSLSKLLLPTLRIGYLAAPAPVIDALAHRISLTDGMGNAVTEETAAHLMENGELLRHSRKAWRLYAKRRLNFARLLEQHLGAHAKFDMPDGGLAFWVRFDREIMKVEEQMRQGGLRFASSQSFATRDTATPGLRFGFASLTDIEAEETIMTVARALS